MKRKNLLLVFALVLFLVSMASTVATAQHSGGTCSQDEWIYCAQNCAQIPPWGLACDCISGDPWCYCCD